MRAYALCFCCMFLLCLTTQAGKSFAAEPNFAAVQKAAKGGDAKAQFNLGSMYDQGRGVAKNERKAVEWYQKAAAQGNASAQNNLGVMYSQGRGVAKDERKAVEWYKKSAAQGHEAAKKALAGMKK